jgi:hypothetical protein
MPTCPLILSDHLLVQVAPALATAAKAGILAAGELVVRLICNLRIF